MSLRMHVQARGDRFTWRDRDALSHAETDETERHGQKDSAAQCARDRGRDIDTWRHREEQLHRDSKADTQGGRKRGVHHG